MARTNNSGRTASLNIGDFDAVLLDLDGVVTKTAKIHAQAWKVMFDDYLRERASQLGARYEPFSIKHDYKTYVDGKPRYDGVASFLESRNIYLPHGEETDPADRESICGLGNRKTKRFLDAIRQNGVEIYESTIDFIRRIKSYGLKVAVVTSSRNCNEILDAAGVGDLFDAQVDGNVAHDWMLDGKPAPDTYLEAARRLGVKPRRAVVVEDAVAGVRAGKAGHFGLVIGMSRDGVRDLLRESGADVILSDLSELELDQTDRLPARIAPSALERWDEIRAQVRDRRVAVFLDYDGTLTPIVERPDLAVLSDDMRATLKALADYCTVFLISGRKRSDIERLVGLGNVVYAGCHGFDIAGPKDMAIEHEEGVGYVPVVAQAARELDRRLAGIEGVIVEDKTYAVAVHFRQVRAEDVGRVEHIVDSVLEQHSLLRKTRGKKVLELRPNINWDKGKAVLWLLDALGLNQPDDLAIYFGDDLTDRDAFRALQGKGLSILVAGGPQETCADYRLSDTTEVRTFLNELTSVLSGNRE